MKIARGGVDNGPSFTWDAFISYTSEDKTDFVRPLSERLRKEGMSVWFDEFEIQLGDSITQAIERGLANSKIGIIVISNRSLQKNWTKYEVSALKTMYINYGRRLIPIWKDVEAETIKNDNPGLLDVKAIVCKNRTIEEIAYDIIAVSRPDILSRINYRFRIKALDEASEVVRVDTRLIALPPRRRDKLPRRDFSRIRLLHGIFFDIFRDKVEDWIDSFCRDLDYEHELFFWEMVGAMYLSWTREHHYSRGDKKRILYVLMRLIEGC